METKIKWTKFAVKCWTKGIGIAVKEEIVPVTTNKIDDVVIGLVNQIADKLDKDEAAE